MKQDNFFKALILVALAAIMHWMWQYSGPLQFTDSDLLEWEFVNWNYILYSLTSKGFAAAAVGYFARSLIDAVRLLLHKS